MHSFNNNSNNNSNINNNELVSYLRTLNSRRRSLQNTDQASRDMQAMQHKQHQCLPLNNSDFFAKSVLNQRLEQQQLQQRSGWMQEDAAAMAAAGAGQSNRHFFSSSSSSQCSNSNESILASLASNASLLSLNSRISRMPNSSSFNEQNDMQTSTSTTTTTTTASQKYALPPLPSLNATRRRSFNPPLTSSLKSVNETRSSSPVFSLSTQQHNDQFQLQQHMLQQQQMRQDIMYQRQLNQQQMQLEKKLGLLVSKKAAAAAAAVMSSVSGGGGSSTRFDLDTSSTADLRGASSQLIPNRLRAASIGSVSSSNSSGIASFADAYYGQLSCGASLSASMSNSKSDLSTSCYSSLTGSNNSNNNNYNNSSINSTQFESLEEKLVTTGNIFERRDDWSILGNLPISKQNTIHVRLEDEGPYGNDEIRCFVLAHLSSLGIKTVSCVVCDSALHVYDKFPLVDGTLFASPLSYDAKKAIPWTVAHRHQFIYAVCLKCILNSDRAHDISCRYCSTSWQSAGGSALQIGTLYKYDVFAAFPCCQERLRCSQCRSSLMSIDDSKAQFFSSFSAESTCEQCKLRTSHFVKPIEEIYSKC